MNSILHTNCIQFILHTRLYSILFLDDTCSFGRHWKCDFTMLLQIQLEVDTDKPDVFLELFHHHPQLVYIFFLHFLCFPQRYPQRSRFFKVYVLIVLSIFILSLFYCEHTTYLKPTKDCCVVWNWATAWVVENQGLVTHVDIKNPWCADWDWKLLCRACWSERFSTNRIRSQCHPLG